MYFEVKCSIQKNVRYCFCSDRVRLCLQFGSFIFDKKNLVDQSQFSFLQVVTVHC